MAYDFSTLNDKDFEELVRDILSIKLAIDFQSFKSGKDQGIDLRYASNNNENEIIVQTKHFLNSGVNNLKSVLKKQEVIKVKALNPKRYIFVTSLPFNPKGKEEIKNIFSPYTQSTGDILGKEDLNNFLRNNSQVVENHYKLWFSGTAVLKRILNNGIKGRSEFTKENVRNRVRIFVPSKTHKLAVDIINKNHFILITGAPGIGKTTMANFLTYQFLSEGFELVYVREIKEAEDLFMSNKKQVFYFDDFLGAVTLDLKSSRNADSAVINFTERIRADKQKRLILTCRTTILNQAKQQSEKIENSKIEFSKYEVSINNYTNIDKARILYNHIYFSNLSQDLKLVFFENQFYWKIIKHKHYNPRVVEFFTDIDRLESGIDYSEEVLAFLDDPSKIWEKSYINQISDDAKFFLSTLYSLGGKYIVQELRLKNAYDSRLEYEVRNNNYINRSGSFNKVIKELLGGFINRIHTIEDNYTTIEYRFFNPSIEDFLYLFFTKNIEEYFVILKSAYYIGQFKERITTSPDKNSKKVFFGEKINYNKLLSVFNNRLASLKENETNLDLDIVIVLIRLFKWNDIKEKVIEIMNNFSRMSLSWDGRDNLLEILDYVANNDLMDEFGFSVGNLLLVLSENMTNYFEIEAFSRLISRQEIYKEVIENSKKLDLDYYNKIQNNIDQSWIKSLDYYINQTANLNAIINKDELITTIEKRKHDAKKFNEWLNLNPSPAIDEYLFDYESQINKNIEHQTKQETSIKSVEIDSVDINETLQINKLFNSDSEEAWD